MQYQETIAAIATSLGESSIAVIRVSGFDAIGTVDRLFKGKVSLLDVPSHTVWYGHICSMNDGSVVDEVLVTVMKLNLTT